MFLFAGFAACALFTQPHEEKSFLSWMRQHNQLYTGDEYNLRFGIFLANKRYIESFNKQDRTFTLRLSQFAAYTPAEYKSMLGFVQGENKRETVETIKVTKGAAPESFDWREKGFIQPIKDQGQCGSCWAFGTVAAQECVWAIKTGEKLSLSESNLVDCVMDCLGCQGGQPGWAMTWVKLFQGGKFMLESDYPYVAARGWCKFDSTKGVTKLTTHKNLASGDEEGLKESVFANGAHTIAIDAGQTSFHSYSTGVYYEPSCSGWTLNHAVCCVGYGVEQSATGNLDYWIVKNSWGTSWGENGYIRMSRNRDNNCGVASQAQLPVV